MHCFGILRLEVFSGNSRQKLPCDNAILHIIIDVRRNSVADLTVLMEYVTVRRRNVNVVQVIRVLAVTNMHVIPLSTHVMVRQLYATLILRTLRTFKYLVFGLLTVEDCVFYQIVDSRDPFEKLWFQR